MFTKKFVKSEKKSTINKYYLEKEHSKINFKINIIFEFIKLNGKKILQ